MISLTLQFLFVFLIILTFSFWFESYRTNSKIYDLVGWYLDTIAFAICLIDVSFFRKVDDANYFIISVAFIAAFFSSIRLTYENRRKKE